MEFKALRWIIVLALVGACGGPTKPARVDVPVDDSNARTESVRDVLWSLAPPDALFGVVAAPGTALRLHSMGLEALRVVESGAMGTTWTKKFRAELQEIPFDLLKPDSLEGAGIDLELGAAMFYTKQERVLLVLPVSDREALRSFAGAKLDTYQGLQVDRFDDDFACAEKQGLYFCMETVEELLANQQTPASSLSERTRRLPAQYRGDLELVMDMAAVEQTEGGFGAEFDEAFEGVGLFAAAVKLGHGSMTARGWLQGRPIGVLANTAINASALSNLAMELRPSSFMRFVVPVDLIGKGEPDRTLPGGLSMKKDLFAKLTGEFVAYAPSSKTPWGRFAFGVTDPSTFSELLDMACAMLPTTGVPGLVVTKGENRCDIVADPAKIPDLDADVAQYLPNPLTASIEVMNDQVAFTLGQEAGIIREREISVVGNEILNRDWSYSLWAQNISVVSGLETPWATFFADQPKSVQDGMGDAIWLLSHVSEFASAFSFQEDGAHMLLHLGTYAGDEPEVYAAFERALRKNIWEGASEDDFAAIAERWPRSMAAQQGLARSPFSILLARTLSTISVPAFLEYLHKSEEAAAQIGN